MARRLRRLACRLTEFGSEIPKVENVLSAPSAFRQIGRPERITVVPRSATAQFRVVTIGADQAIRVLRKGVIV